MRMKTGYVCILLVAVLLSPSALSSMPFDPECRKYFDPGPGEKLDQTHEGGLVPSLAAIDYDNDGDLDFLEGGDISIYMVTNKGGKFEKTILYSSFGEEEPLVVMGRFAVADFNNDGYQDFILSDIGGRVWIWINEGSEKDKPNFSYYVYADFGQCAFGLDSADFDDDGLVDFVVSHETLPAEYITISIFYNRGNLTFERKDIYRFNTWDEQIFITDLVARDYDDDGDIDILFGASYFEWYGIFSPWPIYVKGQILYLENVGNETFAPPRLMAERGKPLRIWLGLWFFFKVQAPLRIKLGLHRIHPSIASADFDMDGDFDFATIDQSGKVELFLNDGSANFTSVGIIHRYGYGGTGGNLDAADFDVDGDADLLISILDYYGCDFGWVYLKRNLCVS